MLAAAARRRGASTRIDPSLSPRRSMNRLTNTTSNIQDVFNTDHEEKLVQGLQRAALQFLREHRPPSRPMADGGEGEGEGDEDDGEVSDGALGVGVGDRS